MRVFKAITFCLVLGSVAAASGSPQDDEAILHVLGRTGFGARPGDVERVRGIRLDRYIESQLNPGAIQDAGVEQRLARFETLGLSSSEIAGRFYRPPQQRARQQQRPDITPQRPDMAPPQPDAAAAPAGGAAPRQGALPLIELSQQKLLRATYSERQLQEVLVDFWFNHFNVFAGKGQFARFYLTEYEREAIRPHVLGRFRDMLGATAESAAMLWYLDNWMSAAPGTDPAAAGGRPARPARGLNENYGRELLELHTLGVDGGYTQKDVVEVARAFTGWTIDAPRRGGGAFTFNERIHDNREKTVLGRRIPAGGGKRDGERVLDIVAAHPSTAKHIARKLVTRFVSDAPPAPLVDRAAREFIDSGGDLNRVMRVILKSPEFMAPAARRAKMKTPFEFVVSALRATGADVAGAAPLVQQLRTLGMPLYGAQPPTGYDDTAASWVNSGALINRMNFAVALVAGRLPGTRVPVASVDPDVIVSPAALSPATRATVGKAADAPQRIALLLGSPEFQKR